MTTEITYRPPLARILFDLNWSARRLAEESGVGESTISRFLNGGKVPSALNLLKLAKAVERQPWELLDRPELAVESA